MLHSSSRAVYVSAIVAFVAGCSGPSLTNSPATCAAVYTPAVSIVVVDSISGVPLAAVASGTVQMPGVSDTLHHGSAPADSLMFGGSSPGTYGVTVTRAGYQPWARTGIVVAASAVCVAPVTVDLRARLQPAP